MKKTAFQISMRCYYPNGETTNHYQTIKLSDIPKWIEAYKFTHPNCVAITAKIWFGKEEPASE